MSSDMPSTVQAVNTPKGNKSGSGWKSKMFKNKASASKEKERHQRVATVLASDADEIVTPEEQVVANPDDIATPLAVTPDDQLSSASGEEVAASQPATVSPSALESAMAAAQEVPAPELEGSTQPLDTVVTVNSAPSAAASKTATANAAPSPSQPTALPVAPFPSLSDLFQQQQHLDKVNKFAKFVEKKDWSNVARINDPPEDKDTIHLHDPSVTDEAPLRYAVRLQVETRDYGETHNTQDKDFLSGRLIFFKESDESAENAIAVPIHNLNGNTVSLFENIKPNSQNETDQPGPDVQKIIGNILADEKEKITAAEPVVMLKNYDSKSKSSNSMSSNRNNALCQDKWMYSEKLLKEVVSLLDSAEQSNSEEEKVKVEKFKEMLKLKLARVVYSRRKEENRQAKNILSKPVKYKIKQHQKDRVRVCNSASAFIDDTARDILTSETNAQLNGPSSITMSMFLADTKPQLPKPERFSHSVSGMYTIELSTPGGDKDGKIQIKFTRDTKPSQLSTRDFSGTILVNKTAEDILSENTKAMLENTKALLQENTKALVDAQKDAQQDAQQGPESEKPETTSSGKNPAEKPNSSRAHCQNTQNAQTVAVAPKKATAQVPTSSVRSIVSQFEERKDFAARKHAAAVFKKQKTQKEMRTVTKEIQKFRKFLNKKGLKVAKEDRLISADGSVVTARLSHSTRQKWEQYSVVIRKETKESESSGESEKNGSAKNGSAKYSIEFMDENANNVSPFASLVKGPFSIPMSRESASLTDLGDKIFNTPTQASVQDLADFVKSAIDAFLTGSSSSARPAAADPSSSAQPAAEKPSASAPAAEEQKPSAPAAEEPNSVVQQV